MHTKTELFLSEHFSKFTDLRLLNETIKFVNTC